MTPAPYVIETLDGDCDCMFSDNGCCGHAPRFLVVGPDGVALGIAFAKEQDAEDTASDLNEAWHAGYLAATERSAPAIWRKR